MVEACQCPECGVDFEAVDPSIPCPACLMKLGLESWIERRSGSGVSSGRRPRFVAPKPEDLAVRFPNLEIEQLVGQGGMGAVYRARQRELDRPVALKILPSEVAADPTFAERFSREARLLAGLDHPNIVRVYDFGRADDVYYLLMEYVDGKSLLELVQDKGPSSPLEAADFIRQAASGLEHAHQADS